MEELFLHVERGRDVEQPTDLSISRCPEYFLVHGGSEGLESSMDLPLFLGWWS